MNNIISHKNAYWIFFFVGFAVYFPIFFNGFVWDDIVFVINNPQVHQFNLSVLLGNNLFNDGPFYRPIPAMYFASLYSLFSNNAFFYHLLQLTLHVICTSLLFIFFTRCFKQEISFFLALVFLVHPINLESVAFIGATQSELYFIPGIVALLLATEKKLTQNRLFIIGLLLLISILTKEPGFLFFLLILMYRYLFKLNSLTTFAKLGIGIVSVYLMLRVLIAGVTYEKISFLQISTLPLWERILHIPAIFLYYLKTFVFPLKLIIWQQWIIKTITIENFIIPLFICALFFIGILIAAFYLNRSDQKQHKVELKNLPTYLFFVIWFLVGMSILLQLIPLDMTVADRWFYFPIVGLLGMLGVAIQILEKSSLYKKKFFVYLAIMVLIFLSFRTIIRTFDWKDNMTLYGHDLREENDNYLLLDIYGREMYAAGYIDDAINYGERSVSIYPTRASLNELGTYYQKEKRYTQAIDVYTKSINISQTKPYTNKLITPYLNVASALLLDKRPIEAKSFIKTKALNDFPDNPDLYVLLSFAESEAGNQQGALEAISQAQNLSPNDEKIAQLYLRLKNNIPIKWNL